MLQFRSCTCVNSQRYSPGLNYLASYSYMFNMPLTSTCGDWLYLHVIRLFFDSKATDLYNFSTLWYSPVLKSLKFHAYSYLIALYYQAPRCVRLSIFYQTSLTYHLIVSSAFLFLFRLEADRVPVVLMLTYIFDWKKITGLYIWTWSPQLTFDIWIWWHD